MPPQPGQPDDAVPARTSVLLARAQDSSTRELALRSLLTAAEQALKDGDSLEARRLIQQGSMNLGPDRTKITDPNAPVAVTSGLVVRVGGRRIVRARLV